MNNQERKRATLTWEHGAVLVMLLFILVEIIVWRVGQRSRSELWQAVEEGAGPEQVEALFILANRDIPTGVNEELLSQMLASDQLLVREFAMTYHLTRFAGDNLQSRYIKQLPDPAERKRFRLLLERAVGKRPGIRHKEIEDYFQSLENSR